MSTKSVLYVEDDFNCRYLVRTILGHEGYNVLEAIDGLQALNILRDERPDLIIMDIHLPGGINGIEITSEIRKSASLSQTPVVALTSDYDWVTDEQIAQAGFVDYLPKPFDRTRLLTTVRRLLGPLKPDA